MTVSKPILRALAGERLSHPPVWLMRQAGRYLPEYRATREKAGGFLDLCYNPDLATEVTLQPIRRYGFDASILFADILLIPQALGADLWFVTGEGPRLSTITDASGVAQLRTTDDIHETLSPIYQTVRNLSEALPAETTLIGFAGAPWTVATYMVAGRGTPDQAPARRMLYSETDAFLDLIDRIADATAAYLIAQIEAGAEVVKLFDSWAATIPGPWFERIAIAPVQKIIAKIHAVYPDTPVIGFPRGAGVNYAGYAKATGVAGLAIDTSVDPSAAAEHLQPITCVQGNLDPLHMVLGGDSLVSETRRIKEALSGGPHIFNLGHGITPDADPANVDLLLKTIRG